MMSSLMRAFQLWAHFQLSLMNWWHWQLWWRCNAIQELQTLSNIASSANFESDDDDDEGEEENKMLLSGFRVAQGQGCLLSLKGPVTKMMNAMTLPKRSNNSLCDNFQKSTKQIGDCQRYI